jgi:pilus assembly protein CpaB
MRGAQIGFLVFGLGLAGYGVFMAQSYITETQSAIAMAQAHRQGPDAGVQTVQVLVAGRPIRYGEPITPADVRAVTWPAAAVPPGTYTNIDALVPDPRRPRVALRAMEPFEPILEVKVSQPGQPAGIAATLSPGLRAFTIRVDNNSGISGTLRPGDMVDLYWSGRGPTGEVTRLLASAVRLIALDENADQDRSFSGIPRSVTVEAAPELVATIAQGQSTGRLSLSVVGLDDERDLAGIEVDSRRLLGVEETVAAPAERCMIRTRRGGDVIAIEIPCTN